MVIGVVYKQPISHGGHPDAIRYELNGRNICVSLFWLRKIKYLKINKNIIIIRVPIECSLIISDLCMLWYEFDKNIQSSKLPYSGEISEGKYFHGFQKSSLFVEKIRGLQLGGVSIKP